MTNANGRILWQGPSPIDGAPLVAIATGFTDSSANGKTGPGMIQTWIMRADMAPHDALRIGADLAVCGNCPHRKYNNSPDGSLTLAQGSCYVKVYQAPLAVWNCYKFGSGYALIGDDLALFDGATVRIGSYGDPAMVPVSVWQEIIRRSSAHTAYTHQWRQPFAQGLKGLAQASCDGISDYLEATAAGWRTFLVKPAGSGTPAGTAHCAASVERGARTTCAQCHLCDGASANVVINAHGSSKGKVLLRN